MAKKKPEITSIRSIKECPDCASQNLVYNEERQQIICRDCGLIYEPMAPQLESQFEITHSLGPRTVAQEKIMIQIEEEKPKKAKIKKQKKAPKKAAKKAMKKPKKKAVKKAVKKQAKKKAKPAAKKPAKKVGLMHRLRQKLMKKKKK